MHSVTGTVTSRAGVESYDLAAFAALEGSERASAVDMLIARVTAGIDDPRAPATLASAEAIEAIEPLEEALTACARNATRIEVGVTLWILGRRRAGLDAALDMLARDGDPELRERAARRVEALEGADDVIDAALLESIARDPVGAVRLCSELALYSRLGLDVAKDKDPCRAATIPGLLYSSLPTVRAEGVRLLEALTASVRSGVDPAAASFEGNDPARVQAFDESWRSSADERPDYDLDALRSFVGDAVPWAEDRLLRDLDADPRGARALAVVGTARVLAFLEEAARQDDRDLAEAAAAALARLRS